MARTLILLICLISLIGPVSSKNFFEDVGNNIKNAFTPSKFICDKYEKQEYEAMVLKPGQNLAFTEMRLKRKYCVDWEFDADSALGKKCTKYQYINGSPEEESRMYQKVKRYRTVCKQGHSTR